MKKQIVSIFAYSVLGLSAVMVSCGDSKTNEPTKSETPAGEMAFLRADIEGMTCAIGCAKPIEKMLSETEGVASAEVNYEKKAAFINYDKSKVSEEALLKLISEYKEGTYKAMASNKQCKSDCKKSCCAVAAVEKKVKSVKDNVTKKATDITKEATEKVTGTIVTGKTKTAKTLNDGKKVLDNSIKAVSTTTGKAITKGKEGITKGKDKVLTTGGSLINDGKSTINKTKTVTKSKLNSAKGRSIKEVKKADEKADEKVNSLLRK